MKRKRKEKGTIESHTLSEEALGSFLCSVRFHDIHTVASWDYLAPEHWCLLGTPWLINASPSLLSHPVSQSTASVPLGHEPPCNESPYVCWGCSKQDGWSRKNAGAHKSRVPFSMSDLREARLNLRGRPSSCESWPGSAPPTSATASLAATVVLSVCLAWTVLFSEHPVSSLVSAGPGHAQFPLRTFTAHPISPHSPQTRSNPSVPCYLTNVVRPV